MENVIKDVLAQDKILCEEKIKEYISGTYGYLDGLIAAQRYSLLAGGKRIRPILVLEFCRLFGGVAEHALPYALAIEMVHTASLIHDDLPAIDNDDLRRGMPTNHKVHGEATALLAADGLFLDAFRVIAANKDGSAEKNLAAVSVLAEATGSLGMVGGEYMDVMAEGTTVPREVLDQMHALKTGALIRGACMLGAISAGIMPGDARMAAVVTYAECIGLAFQITDDVLDRTGTAERLGKNPGADDASGKTTFLSFMTVDEAREMAAQLTARAVDAIKDIPGSNTLTALAEALSGRDF